MADRVKYFLLGLLFLVVAGVIAYDQAYDRWNPDGGGDPAARRDSEANRGEAFVGPKPDPLIVQPGPGEPPASPPAPPANREPAAPVPGPQAPPPEVRTEPVVPPAPPKPEPEPEKKKAPDRFHIVRSGETLEAIAMQYYKTRDGIAWIVNANAIRDPNRIHANTRLIIPAALAARSPADTVKVATTPATKVPARHVVRAGDGDLYAICRRYYGAGGEGARVAEIMSLNNLFSADVAVGSEIRLPPK